jgi:hypothetical protein
MLFVRFMPGAEDFLHREQCKLRELLQRFRVDALRLARPVIVIGGDFLSRRRIQIFKIRLGDFCAAVGVRVLVDKRHRRFRQNAHRGHNHFYLVRTQLLDREQGLIFPSEQHIADSALNERRRRATGTRVEHRHILIQCCDVFLRFRLVVAVLSQRVAPAS